MVNASGDKLCALADEYFYEINSLRIVIMCMTPVRTSILVSRYGTSGDPYHATDMCYM